MDKERKCMGDIIIIGIIVLVVLLGLPSALKHFKGEGGCCGGGGSVKESKNLDVSK